MSYPTIFHDPRYWDFCEQFHADPLGFALLVCNMSPSADQEQLFVEIAPENAKVSIVSGTGCFAKGTLMMRSNGEPVAVEDVRVGDRLMGPDGNSARNVLELRCGREPMYRFTYVDGTSHVFNESHILTLAPSVKYISRGKTDIINITVKDWLSWPKTRRERYHAYRSAVEKFERDSADLPIPPYVFGVWLGDGSIHKPQITTADEEISDAFIEYANSVGCDVVKVRNSDNSWCFSIKRTIGTEQANPLTKALRKLGIDKKKFIPDLYKFSTRENRLELLAGIIDTDGHFDKGSGGFDFIQKCERMAKDVAWLARSVGCHSTVRKVSKTCYNNGVSGDYWRVTIGRNTGIIPVRIARKKDDGRRRFRNNTRFSIKKVECLGEGDYYGFVLDGDHRFLGYDFTVLHNTGKTAAFARIALWHLLCFPVAYYEGKLEIGSNTYIGAPRIQQVSDGVWKEMNDVRLNIADGPYAWINDYYRIDSERVTVKGFEKTWFIGQVAMQQGQSIGVAGKHRYWQLIIVDEAAGVSDEHFKVIDGTQTQAGNRTLLASQGVRNTGKFYETHHNLSKANGSVWTALRFNSEHSPFVTIEWLKEREEECGGRNQIEYRIRVLGLFAEDSGSILLTRAEIEKPFDRGQIIADDEPFGLLVLGDVAMGEYRDESVAVLAKVIGYGDSGPDARRVEYIEIPYCTNSKDEITFAGDLVNYVGKLSNATLLTDNGGVGATVNKLIEASGVPVVKVNWGEPCFKTEYKNRFYNKRACAMVRFRDAVKSGRVSFRMNIDRRIKEKILLQGSRLPYHFAEAGGLRYQMEKKEVMRKNGIKSPDIIDAMSFAFLEDAFYAPADTAGGVVSKFNDMDRAAEEAFEGV